MNKKLCPLCKEEYDVESGHLTKHLLSVHSFSRADLLVYLKYDGIRPKCQCGYCNEDADYYPRKNKFTNINKPHRKFSFIEENYIKKYGYPKCITCKEDSRFHRGVPLKYCTPKCQPGNWNNDKVKKTVMEKYGVKNVFQLESVKAITKQKVDRKLVAIKARKTKIIRFKNTAFDVQKMQNTLLRKYGVTHFSKTSMFKAACSKRMSINNPMFIDINVKKMSNTHKQKAHDGYIIYKTMQYKDTNLRYQSKLEYKFLELCEELNVIDKISRCKTFKYLDQDKAQGNWFIPDFLYKDNIIVEVKATYVMEKLQKPGKQEAIRRSVESEGYKYLILLDGNMLEFINII